MNQVSNKENNKMTQVLATIAQSVSTMKETMSSLEIAKLTGKRHADVLRDIRVFLEDLGESTERKFASSYEDTTGRTLPCYELPKRECLGLASGYDAKLRMMIIDRWAELEAKEGGNQTMYSDPRLNALDQYDKELEISERIWKRLGMKKIDRDVEAVQVGRRIEKRLLVSDLVPPAIANRAAKIEKATKKLVEVDSSGKHVKPVRLLNYLGYKESTYFAKYINSALMDMGLQTYHPDRPSYYTPVGAGNAIAATDTIGGIKDVIIGWEPVRTSEALKEYFTKNPTKEPK